MRVRIPGMEIAAGLIALCASGLAMAAPCYMILDRNDAVIYRDTEPPIDLSAGNNSPERKALRQRGQHLIVAEFERCDAVGYISPTTGGTQASVDDIVMQLRPAIGTSVGSANAGTYSPSRKAISAPSAPAPSAPAAKSSAPGVSRSY